ncbi:hypothetical protein ABT120_11725 [Nonomuraea angiospora]|uniref:hypothetical protein n=1 Tax=Nonomuraea angiospora TaxID=46172 RepID=UPI0033288AD2
MGVSVGVSVGMSVGVSVGVVVGVSVGVSLIVGVGVGVPVGVVPDAAEATPIPPVVARTTAAATISGRGTRLRGPSVSNDSSSCGWSVGGTLSSTSGLSD